LLNIDNPKGIKISKKVQGLNEVKFFDLNEIKELEIYDDIRQIIFDAEKVLNKKK
jgi:hypothetical protein